MFRIKICGVRSPSDAQRVIDCGGDCIGLNFYAQSKRFVEMSAAASLCAHSAALSKVGVFVNRAVADVIDTALALQLDAVQLHGDESPEEIPALRAAGVSVIRAVRLPTSKLSAEQIDAMVMPWHQAGAHILLDADGGQEFGGSGQRLDWDGIGRWAETTPIAWWALAGGLNPENVVQAIQRSGAPAVDVASGIEREPGVKDQAKLADFIRSASNALGQK